MLSISFKGNIIESSLENNQSGIGGNMMKTKLVNKLIKSTLFITIILLIITISCANYNNNYKLELYREKIVEGKKIWNFNYFEDHYKALGNSNNMDYTADFTHQPLIFNELDMKLRLCKNRTRQEILTEIRLEGEIVSGCVLDVVPTKERNGYFAFLIKTKHDKYSIIYGDINYDVIKITNKTDLFKGRIICYEEKKNKKEALNEKAVGYEYIPSTLWFIGDDKQTLLKLSLPDLKIKERISLPKKTFFPDISNFSFHQELFGYDGENIVYLDIVNGTKDMVKLGSKGEAEKAIFFADTFDKNPGSSISPWVYFYDGRMFYILENDFAPALAYETELNDFVTFLYKGIIVTKDGVFNYHVENRDIVLNKIDDQVYLPGLDLNGYLMFNNGKLMYRQNGDTAEFIVYHIEDGVYKGKSDVFTLDAKVLDFDVSFATGNNSITPLIFTDKGVYKLVNIK